jgi:hypothetical protein
MKSHFSIKNKWKNRDNDPKYQHFKTFSIYFFYLRDTIFDKMFVNQDRTPLKLHNKYFYVFQIPRD